MSAQGEALRLAAELSKSHLNHHVNHAAAAELRRLHAENEAFGIHLSERMKDLAKAEAQRDALLEALKLIDKEFKKHGRHHWPEAVKARAAIKQAEGENT